MPMPNDNIDAIRAAVARIRWFHTIDLRNGIITPGIDPTPDKLAASGMPASLAGKSVLDIGANDGFFSFEAERRGATRVVALDYFAWCEQSPAYSKPGFDLAKWVLGSTVEEHLGRLEDVDSSVLGTFDLVLYLGVLYHATDPLGQLAKVRSLCREMAIIETHVDALDYPRPACVFYPGATLNGDSTNYFGPNPQAVEAMCKEVGFSRVEAVPQFDGYARFFGQSRQVFHAYT
jgi:tRNA (mo5U34)-methyltransferase